MDIGTSWDIIKTARASAGPGKPFHEALTDHLASVTQQDILQYQERFCEARDALYRRAAAWRRTWGDASPALRSLPAR